MTCMNCEHHTLAGYRLVPKSIPACSFTGEYKDLPYIKVATKEGGFEKVWDGSTPEWCYLTQVVLLKTCLREIAASVLPNHKLITDMPIQK